MGKKDKFERQREQRAAEHVRKAFERLNTALAIMGEVRECEEWTPEELEKLAKIINEWSSILLRTAEKMAERHRRKILKCEGQKNDPSDL